MSNFLQFLGRLHPLLVHMPIGILILAYLFEWVSIFPKYKRLRQAIQPSIMIGALFSFASVGSGLLLSQEGGYDDDLMYLHRNAGIATAIFALLFYFLRRMAMAHFGDKGRRKWARVLLFSLLIILLSFTGHLGGSLTHGTDYLFSVDGGSGSEELVLGISSADELDSMVLYTAVVQPILKARCYSCHSSSRQKGQLRLDQIGLILKGGKHGAVVEAGNPDSSTLYHRLTLPLEDEDHMPPNEKAQPSSSEIAIIHAWIAEGAAFDKVGKAYAARRNIHQYVAALLSMNRTDLILPKEPVAAASEQAVATLSQRQILVVPVGSSTNYLGVNFINAGYATDADLELLRPLAEQLLWLDLSRTHISDAALPVLAEFKNLTHLSLSHTEISGSTLGSLSALPRLSTLNLVGTRVGDDDVKSLGELKSLQKLFLFDSHMSSEGAIGLQATLPNAAVDIGQYALPVLASDTVELPGIH